ncbi:MAG TPA: polysaccharide deacetylase family protein [Streptosporangiaceae bacterium]|nr:polysaccharide deacetylase family protein [Streptosporangiaceae bacterium]
MRMLLAARLGVIAAVAAGLAACGGSAPASGTAPATTPATAAAAPTTGTPASSQAAATPTRTPTPTPTPAAPRSTSQVPSSARPITGRLAGTDWTYIPTTRHVVALTFDAGANADAVPSILATLRRDHVPATFFLTGNFVRDFPAAARAIAAAGFRIGDHTITHPHLTQLGDAAVRREILGGAQQIAAVTGANPAPLFRFPYGDADARTIALANQAGYVPVRWTVDTLGWEGTAGHISASVVASRVLSALKPGEIVLMHVGSNPDDHSTFDADALPRVISELRAHGYSFVTLDALVG